MDINLVYPEFRERMASLPKLPAGSWFSRALVRILMLRRVPRAKIHEGVSIAWVKTSSGQRLRVFTPPSSGTKAALLFIHGGGMIIGSPQMDDALLSKISAELDMVVVSPKYRLAPEHPYPAASDDCNEAWHWMISNASNYDIDTQRIAIGGASAGAGLAAGSVLRIYDEGGLQPIAQLLFCPMLDDQTALNRSLDEIDHFVWDNKLNLIGWTCYLGSQIGSEDVSPYAAPSRRKDLTGLPAAWVGVGDIDLFYDEDRRYAEALKAAGVPCVLDVMAGAPHGFDAIFPDSKAAQDYIARSIDWLSKALQPRSK